MEPIFALPILFAAVAALVLIRSKRKDSTDNIEAARERAKQRAQEKKYANIESLDDPWKDRLDIKVHDFSEVDDSADGRGRLTAEEKRIVNTILLGVDVTYVDEVNKSHTIFGKDNQVKYSDPWSNTVR